MDLLVEGNFFKIVLNCNTWYGYWITDGWFSHGIYTQMGNNEINI